MRNVVRLLLFQQLSGAENMAADEMMLRTAERGHATLRFYGWSEPTVSLGYFQKAESRSTIPGLDQLAWVRRATGGGALVHHHELTYSLAFPAGPEWQPGRRPWPCRIHDAIQAAFKSLEIQVDQHTCGDEETNEEGRPFLCFKHITTGDLTIQGHKVTGSAQRQSHGAILQHGGILLAQSPHAPELPGVSELSGKLVSAEELMPHLMMQIAMHTGWGITAGNWHEVDEKPGLEELISKYRSPEWNEKR